jgi:thermostable 8-oxoguanine DNA glycosylase
MVAGKNAKQTAKKLEKYLAVARFLQLTPFDYLKHQIQKVDALMNLDEAMKEYKLGQYKRLHAAFTGIVQFKNKLKNVTLEELESINGIGPKTARFFILHSRTNQKIAVLDTHILKWMKEQGYDVPKATPPKKRYGIIEQQFLTEARKREMEPAELDLEIWKASSNKKP